LFQLWSYLNNLKYENVLCNSINVLYGVPRGDYLSLILFSLFINDISKILNYSKIFVDVTKLFKKIECIEDLLEFQADIGNLYKMECL